MEAVEVKKFIKSIKKYWQLWVTAIVAILVGKKVAEKKTRRESQQILHNFREAVKTEKEISSKKSHDVDVATAEYMEKVDKIIKDHEKKMEIIENLKNNKSADEISSDQATQLIKDRLK